MTMFRSPPSVSRRSVLADIAGGSLSVALAAKSSHASQEVMPTDMAGHPIIDTWIFDRDIADPIETPAIVVFTSDGALLDPSQGVAGTWQATGPGSAAWTLIDFIEGGAGGYVAVRSTGDVETEGNALTGPYSFTIVAPDGTVVTSGQAESTAVRLQVEPIEAEGTAVPAMPPWEPAPPALATPTG